MNDSSGHQLKEVPTLLGPWFLFPVAAAYILIAVVAAVGNLLVCFAILTNRSLRSKPSNLLLLSLAVSDLLTAVLAMPFDIESLLLQGHWRHGPVMCVTFLTSYLITVPTSILTLLAISLDRYQNLRDPLRRFRRTQFMTRTKALIVSFDLAVLHLICLSPFHGLAVYNERNEKRTRTMLNFLHCVIQHLEQFSDFCWAAGNYMRVKYYDVLYCLQA